MRSSGSEPVECLWSITHGSLMVPDVIRGGIFLNGVCIGHPGPFSTWRLVSLVFVFCPGQLSALGVDFLDRVLALSTPLLLFPVTVRSPSCSRIGVRKDFGG